VLLLLLLLLIVLQTSQRASETADKVSSQAQQTAEETKATLADKAQQVGGGKGAACCVPCLLAVNAACHTLTWCQHAMPPSAWPPPEVTALLCCTLLVPHKGLRVNHCTHCNNRIVTVLLTNTES
jgi:hypothetical protein